MNTLTRRTFLCKSVLGTAGAAFLSPLTSSSAFTRTTPTPCLPTAWTKHGIVIEPTEPWEGSAVQNFTCRAEPLKHHQWRIWYSVSDEKLGYRLAYAEGVPGEPMKKVPAICSTGDPPEAPFAIGNLPEKWHPVQPTHIEMRNGKHRLYFWVHAHQIARYLVAESTDGRRYRVIDPLRPVLYHPNDRAAFGVPSPDGITFASQPAKGRPADEPLATPQRISNDATTIYQLKDGTFEIYSVGLVRVPRTDPAYIAADNAPGLLRVIDRYTSVDGIHIDSRQRIIQRDAEDPADQQFYYLAVTHTSKGRVGMLGHYRCEAQTMDLEWCFSKDGVKWDRPLRHGWLSRGKPPEPDCYGVYAASAIVYRDGLWHLFYTGVNSTHNGKHSYGNPRQVIMHATTKSIWA